MTSSIKTSGKTISRSNEDPHLVTSEFLYNTGTQLTCFFFRHGANFFAFSYDTAGKRKHTLIDTGDAMYQDSILSVLTQHHIQLENVERIIITHSHHDHYGLADRLLRVSGASLLVHANFREHIKEVLPDVYAGKSPAPYHIDYLSPSENHGSLSIHGMNFPRLIDAFQLGDGGFLDILACPESDVMHTADQLIVRYTQKQRQEPTENILQIYRPAEDILFSGDLWLMHGPLFGGGYRTFTRHMRFAYRQVKGMLKGEPTPRRDPRIQDAQAKDALKRGFILIRVMPGHGEDFLGTRMIPSCFLADRDLLLELGYDMNEKKSLLKSPELSPKVKSLREQAYTAVIDEMLLWQKLGYDADEISAFIIRIYEEQTGGGYLVEEDRKERRQRIENTLSRLKEDVTAGKELNWIAESTLAKLSEIA